MGRFLSSTAFVLSAFFIALTLLGASRWARYNEETERLTAGMTEDERALQARILDARTTSLEAAYALGGLQIEHAALVEESIHLRVDIEAAELALIQDGKVLRETAIEVGPEGEVLGDGNRRWIFTLPRGQLTVSKVSANQAFSVPDWWYVEHHKPIPEDGALEKQKIYGDHTWELSDGTLIYATPSVGPWSTGEHRYGAIVASAGDLKAMAPLIQEGAPVYVY